MGVTKKDLEKDGWRISDEGFDHLIGQFDDEPTYQVSIICLLKKTVKNVVLETIETPVRVYDECKLLKCEKLGEHFC